MTTTYRKCEINEEDYAIQRRTNGADEKNLLVIDKSTGTVTVGLHDIADSAFQLFNNDDPAKYVGLRATALSGSQDYDLPTDDGTNGQVLTTNGSGVLSWQDVPTNFAELRYGRSGNITNSEKELKLVNGVDTSHGWRLPDACTAVAVTLQANCSNHSSNGTFTAELHKNNSASGETITSDTVTGTGPVGGSGVVSLSLAVGDTLSVYVTVPSTFTINKTSCVVKCNIT